MKLTNILNVGRYKKPTGGAVNVKKGRIVGRGCDVYFYINRGKRIIIPCQDFHKMKQEPPQ